MQEMTLEDLGWKSLFASQLSPEDLADHVPVRVMAVHRGRLAVVGTGLERFIPSRLPEVEGEEDRPTVGDWLVVERETLRPLHLLQRSSLFKRRSPGAGRHLQLIAANIDILFVVTSCNRDFNLARLERYLVLAREAGVTPIIVLTKADLTDMSEDFARAARALHAGLWVETVDARDPESVSALSSWCGRGQTVALLGSSGVGKSTLVNTLTGGADIATQGVRADDDRGRHTTTARAMHRLAEGGWLLDTPGMRELQLTDAAAGLAEVFDDIDALARYCRFSDCAHEVEPGCAVQAAIAEGRVDRDRLDRWRKLMAEDTFNTQSLAERRARNRAFGKMVHTASKEIGRIKRR